MGQNNIWMRYLIIGGIGSLLLLSISCVKRELVQNAEFYFVNATNHKITYSNGLDKYNLNPYEQKIFSEEQGSHSEINETTYLPPFKVTTFDVTIKFDASKCLIVSPKGIFGPLHIKNYVAEKINKRTYKFTYTFTEADYNRAVTCP